MKKYTLILALVMLANIMFAQHKASITIHAPVLAPDDTLELYVQDERIINFAGNPYQVLYAHNNGGSFYFEIPMNGQRTWISLFRSFQKSGNIPVFAILDEFLLGSGDSVAVQLTPKLGRFIPMEDGYNGNIPIVKENWDIQFLGKDVAMYRAQQEISQIAGSNQQIEKEIVVSYPFAPLLIFQKQEQLALKALKRYKGQLSQNVYRLLVGQVKGNYGYEMGRFLEKGYFYDRNKDTESAFREMLDGYFAEREQDMLNATEIDVLSPKFIDYLTKFIWLLHSDIHEKDKNEEYWYTICKRLVGTSKARDRVLASLLMSRFPYKPNSEALEDAMRTITDSYALSRIKLLENLLIGKEAYRFNLPDAEGVYHKLSDFKGKVVFIDFWYASCLPCRQYMVEVVNPVKKLYKDNPDVVFITISIDDRDTFKRILAQAGFLPETALHLYTDNKGTKHPIIQHYQVRGYPHPLLIGKNAEVLMGRSKLKTKESVITGIAEALIR